MSFGNELERKYHTLGERRDKKRKNQDNTTMVYVSGIMIIIYLLFILPQNNYLIPVSAVITAGIILTIGKILDKKALKFNLTKQEKIFFAFYSNYDKLEKYISEPTDKTKNRSIEALERLSRFIDKWKTDLTPLPLAEIPNSISELLKSLSTFVNANNNTKISLLRDTLYKIAEKSSKSEPDMNTLQEFNRDLLLLFPMTVSVTTTFRHRIEGVSKIQQLYKHSIKGGKRIRQWLNDHPRMPLILIGSIMLSGFLLIILLSIQYPNIISIYFGSGSFTYILYNIYKGRKSSDTNNSQPSKDESSSTKKSYDIQIPPLASKFIDNPYVDSREYTTSIDHPIVWQNNDDEPHSITSGRRQKISADNDVEDGIPDGLFDKTISPHDNFKFTFEKEGVYHYYCKLHKCSEATIIVK